MHHQIFKIFFDPGGKGALTHPNQNPADALVRGRTSVVAAILVETFHNTAVCANEKQRPRKSSVG